MKQVVSGFSKLLPILFVLFALQALADDKEIPNGFVYLRDVDPSIIQDIRYATPDNFTGSAVPGYETGECILAKPVAEALKKVQEEIRKDQLSLKVYDCYRPRRAVRSFIAWAKDFNSAEKTKHYHPNIDKRDLFRLGYIASPSSHSQGVAVDITLVRLPIGFTTSVSTDRYGPCTNPITTRMPDNSVDMGTSWDCLDVLSHTYNSDSGEEQQKHRQYLVDIMHKHGFKNYEKEWWHFSMYLEGYEKYFDFPIERK